MEGLVERKSWGDIAVDDIKVLNGLSMADCKGEAERVQSHDASTRHPSQTTLQNVTAVRFS